MTGLSFSGLWYLDYGFASRMESIIVPRIQAGRDPIPPSMRLSHPAQELTSQPVPAGSMSPSSAEMYADWYRRKGGGAVMVMPVKGTMQRDGVCGLGTSDYIDILKAADRLDAIEAAVIDWNTPGGSVDGTKAFAEAVKAFSKPIVSWTPFCCSAGYFVASQSDEIWLEDQTVSMVGSIGVLSVYIDQSAYLEKNGLKVQIIRADGSEQKATMNGIEPLTEETMAEHKALLNACRQEFLGYVRRGRASKLTSDEWTSGKVFTPSAALRIGLADRKGSLDGAISRALQLAKSK